MDKSLPPLPEPDMQTTEPCDPDDFTDYYTAEQMRDYAAAALRATGEGEWPDDTTHLFSDAMDDAVSAFMAVKHGITRNAENSGETADPERVIRRSLIAAMKTYRETYLRDNPPAAPTPAEPTDPDDMEHDWSNIRRGAINPKTPAEPTNPGEISSKVVEPLRDAGTKVPHLLYALADDSGALELKGPYVLATEWEGQALRLSHSRGEKDISCYAYIGKWPAVVEPDPSEPTTRLFQEGDVHEMLQIAFRSALPPAGCQVRYPNQVDAADAILASEQHRAVAATKAGLTSKQAWWAGARVGLNVSADTPRPEIAARLAQAREPLRDALKESEVIEASEFALANRDGETSTPLEVGMYTSKPGGGFKVTFAPLQDAGAVAWMEPHGSYTISAQAKAQHDNDWAKIYTIPLYPHPAPQQPAITDAARDADNYHWLKCGGWEVLQDPKYWRPEYGFDGAVAAARADVAMNAAQEKARG